jgi:hypothetical protein
VGNLSCRKTKLYRAGVGPFFHNGGGKPGWKRSPQAVVGKTALSTAAIAGRVIGGAGTLLGDGRSSPFTPSSCLDSTPMRCRLAQVCRFRRPSPSRAAYEIVPLSPSSDCGRRWAAVDPAALDYAGPTPLLMAVMSIMSGKEREVSGRLSFGRNLMSLAGPTRLAWVARHAREYAGELYAKSRPYRNLATQCIARGATQGGIERCRHDRWPLECPNCSGLPNDAGSIDDGRIESCHRLNGDSNNLMGVRARKECPLVGIEHHFLGLGASPQVRSLQ